MHLKAISLVKSSAEKSHIPFRMVSDALIILITFIIIKNLTSKLVIEQYGIYSQALIFIALLLPLVTLRLNTAAVRFYKLNANRNFIKNYFYSIGIFLSIFIATSLILLAFPVVFQVGFSGYLSDEDVYVILGFIFSRSIFQLSLDYYRAKGSINISSFLNLIRYILFFSIVLFVESLDAITFILYFSCVEVFLVLLMQIQIIGNNILMSKHKDLEGGSDISEWIRYSIYLVPYALSLGSIQYADRLFIVEYAGIDVAAKYSLLGQLCATVLFFVSSLNYIYAPRYIKSWNENNLQQLILHYEKSLKIFFFLSLPTLIALFLFYVPVVELISSENYVMSNNVVIIMISSQFLFAIFALTTFVIDLKKNTYMLLLISLISALMNIALNIFLVPIYNEVGAVASSFIVAFFQVGYLYKIVHHEFSWVLNWPFAFIFKILIVLIVIIAMVVMLQQPFYIELLLSILIYLLAFLFIYSIEIKSYFKSFLQ